jgi:hypothetical protein
LKIRSALTPTEFELMKSTTGVAASSNSLDDGWEAPWFIVGAAPLLNIFAVLLADCP